MADLDFLKLYVPPMELACLLDGLQSEEKEYFVELLDHIEKEIRDTPPLYANEELGLNAPIRLHYFGGPCNFWITEVDPEERIAFGYACLSGDAQDAELGYISIPEILETGRIELDLHWDKSKTLADVQMP